LFLYGYVDLWHVQKAAENAECYVFATLLVHASLTFRAAAAARIAGWVLT
jgi:hypothetical protein